MLFNCFNGGDLDKRAGEGAGLWGEKRYSLTKTMAYMVFLFCCFINYNVYFCIFVLQWRANGVYSNFFCT